MDRLGRPCKPVWTDGLVARVGRMGRTSRSRKQAWTDSRNGCCLDAVDYLGNFFLIVCITGLKHFLNELLFLNQVPKKMIVFHVKDAKTGSVEILFQRVSNKIIHFIVQTPFFDYSDMSLTWTLNFAFFDYSDMSHYSKKVKMKTKLYHGRSSNPRQTVTTSSKQCISDYHKDDTDVDDAALVYKKTRGVGKIYDPQKS
ncbi:hypothetical protein BpHYR1_043188 [Brachionus plicatilis]|uniref:Uncharacterized protein n=1 Tax=Brachionus plicatilis TaxID=10195 RepID=A0A3M7R9H6_BRAPC|nr:hypothetical protein BpHYR1_043188 [Brachionus plicatilis]